MKNSFIRSYILAVALFFASAIMAQTNQSPSYIDPPKGDGSHEKDTSYSITGAGKNEVRGASGQGSADDSDTIPPKHKRKKFPFTSPNPGNTNATGGSNIAPR